MMTTGYITQGQSALYLAETTTASSRLHHGAPAESATASPSARPDLASFRKPARDPVSGTGKADEGKTAAVLPPKG
jgi:hypothetical protein